MKKSNYKRIITPILLSVLFGSLSLGTTFALFTDKAETKISVGSGKIKLESSLVIKEASSLNDDDLTSLISADKRSVVFRNGGSVTIGDNNEVTISNITPGDSVTFGVSLTNYSTVKTKYRAKFMKSGALSPVLAANLNNLSLFWNTLDATDGSGTKILDDVPLKISFPNGANERDNLFQGKSASIVLAFEAIQGNAATTDIDDGSSISEGSTSATYGPNEEFILVNDNGSAYVTGITNSYGGNVAFSVDKLTSATDSNFALGSGEKAQYFDIKLSGNGVDVSSTNTNPYKVALYVGEGFRASSVTHYHEVAGTYIEDKISDFEYDEKTGYLTFTTNSFSEFYFKYKDKVTTVKTSHGERTYQSIESAILGASQVATEDNPAQIVLTPDTGLKIEEDVTVGANVELTIPFDEVHSEKPEIGEVGTYLTEIPNAENSYLTEESVTKTASKPDQFADHYPENMVSELVIEDGATLTIEEGASFNVAGNLNISSTANNQSWSAYTQGEYCQIIMGKNSKIECYGNLDVYGFIKEAEKDNGSEINMYSGSTLYEPFVVYDYRNGSHTAACYYNNTSPFDQFDCPNVHAKINFNYGSKLVGFTGLFTSSTGTPNMTSIALIGPDTGSLINLQPGGSLESKYHTDKNNLTSYEEGYTDLRFKGNCILESMKMNAAGQDMDMEELLFPISFKHKIFLEGGEFESKAQFKLMPGAEFYVNKNSTLRLSENVMMYPSGYVDKNTIGSTKYPSGKDAGLLKVDGTIIAEKGLAGHVNFGNDSNIILRDSFIDTLKVQEGVGSRSVFSLKFTKTQLIENQFSADNLDMSTITLPANLHYENELWTEGHKVNCIYKFDGLDLSELDSEISQALANLQEVHLNSELDKLTFKDFDALFDIGLRVEHFELFTDLDFSNQFSYDGKNKFYVGDFVTLENLSEEYDNLYIKVFTKQVDKVNSLKATWLTGDDNPTLDLNIGTYKVASDIKYAFTEKNVTYDFMANYPNLTLYVGQKIRTTGSVDLDNLKIDGCSEIEENGESVYVIEDVDLDIKITSSSCLTGDSLVTLSNGHKKAIKDIKAGEEVLTFDHETGTLTNSKVLFNEIEDKKAHNVLHLLFDNEHIVDVVSQHGFFDFEENKYVYISPFNYEEYIGHRFYGENGVVTLLNGFVSREKVKTYSLVTDRNLNFFADGILSMPGGISGMFNIFEYDENLKYDEAKKALDIEKYGLFTYEDFKDLISESVYEAFNGSYLKVAIGKGLISWEEIEALINRYSQYFEGI